MIKFVLLLVYLMGGEVKVEQRAFDNAVLCEAAGIARVQELIQHPKFNQGLLATCVEARVSNA